MHIEGSSVSSLPYIDDKLAAVMMYGISTGFENSQFLGLKPNPAAAPGLSVGAYNTCSGSPQYWTYTYAGENLLKPGGVSGTNDRMMKFDGCVPATSSRSYAYLNLTTSSYDRLPADNPDGYDQPCITPIGNFQCYLQIKSNMNLRWLQYNASQCTASLDIEFSDGTFLRDKKKQIRPGEFVPFTDTSGVSVHPADRDCLKNGQGHWFYVQIDLTPFQNLRVKRIIVGFDNSNNTSIRGNWRVYFDEVTLGY